MEAVPAKPPAETQFNPQSLREGEIAHSIVTQPSKQKLAVILEKEKRERLTQDEEIERAAVGVNLQRHGEEWGIHKKRIEAETEAHIKDTDENRKKLSELLKKKLEGSITGEETTELKRLQAESQLKIRYWAHIREEQAQFRRVDAIPVSIDGKTLEGSTDELIEAFGTNRALIIGGEARTVKGDIINIEGILPKAIRRLEEKLRHIEERRHQLNVESFEDNRRRDLLTGDSQAEERTSGKLNNEQEALVEAKKKLEEYCKQRNIDVEVRGRYDAIIELQDMTQLGRRTDEQEVRTTELLAKLGWNAGDIYIKLPSYAISSESLGDPTENREFKIYRQQVDYIKRIEIGIETAGEERSQAVEDADLWYSRKWKLDEYGKPAAERINAQLVQLREVYKAIVPILNAPAREDVLENIAYAKNQLAEYYKGIDAIQQLRKLIGDDPGVRAIAAKLRERLGDDINPYLGDYQRLVDIGFRIRSSAMPDDMRVRLLHEKAPSQLTNDADRALNEVAHVIREGSLGVVLKKRVDALYGEATEPIPISRAERGSVDELLRMPIEELENLADPIAAGRRVSELTPTQIENLARNDPRRLAAMVDLLNESQLGRLPETDETNSGYAKFLMHLSNLTIFAQPEIPFMERVQFEDYVDLPDEKTRMQYLSCAVREARRAAFQAQNKYPGRRINLVARHGNLTERSSEPIKRFMAAKALLLKAPQLPPVAE